MTTSRGRSAAELMTKNIGESVVRIEADALRASGGPSCRPDGGRLRARRRIALRLRRASRRHGNGQERPDRPQDRCDPHLDRQSCLVSPSCGSPARRSRNGSPRRRRSRSFGQRRNRRNPATARYGQAVGSAAHHLDLRRSPLNCQKNRGAAQPWRKPPRLLSTAPSPTKRVRWDSRPRPRPRPCSLWAMRLPSRSPSVADSRKRTSPTCIPAANWASDSRASLRSCTLATLFRA